MREEGRLWRCGRRAAWLCGGWLLRLRLCVLAMVIAALAFPAWAQPVPDRDTLLLANFDGSLDADFARGSPSGLGRASFVRGRFGQGVLLEGEGRVSFAGNDGNFHAPSGTIEFWIQPKWPGNDSLTHTVFFCRFGTRGYIRINYIGDGRFGVAISSGEGNDWRWRRADADISAWKANKWHHVACAWGDGKLRVFVDGQPGVRAVDDARMPDALPETLELQAADAVIDGLRISRRPYTLADVRASIEATSKQPPFRHVEDLLASGKGELRRGRTLVGNIRLPLIVGTSRFMRGFACSAGEAVTIPLGGQFDTFRAQVGLEAFSHPNDRCVFRVHGDGQTLFESQPLKKADGLQAVSVSITGVRKLELRIWPAGPMHGTTLGVWANAVVARRGADVVVPPPRPIKPATLEMYRRQATADRYEFPLSGEAGFRVAAKFWEDDLDPSQPPPADRIGGPLSGFATPGEYEPMAFVVYATQDLRDVRVTVSGLQSDGAVIPADRVDVRLVLRGLMRDLYVYPPERSTVVSRFLWPYQPVDIPAGTMREYLLTVHVPEEASAGVYRGSVRIEPSAMPPVEVPIEFEVLPFRLRPLRRKAYGVYFRFPRDESEWPAVEGQLDDIRAHGCTLLKASIGVEWEKKGDEIRASVDRLRHALQLLRKHGFHGPLPVSTGCPQAAALLAYDPVRDYGNTAARARFFAAVRGGMQKLQRLAKDFPEFELLPTHMDEVFGRDRLERYIRLTEAVRRACALRVYITLHNSPRPGIPEMMQRCDPYVDVRCYNGHAMDEWIRAGHSFEELASQLKESGDEAWVYYNIRGSFFKPEWTRLVNGFYLWISPLRIHVPWMYYSVHGNPVDDTDGPPLRGHDFVYAVPHPQQPDRLISTRHWEAFREGVDDMRYLGTLEELIAERKGTATARAAQAWLDRLRNGLRPDPKELSQVEGESPILRTWAKRFDGPDYRRFRREAADWISRLSQSDP